MSNIITTSPHTSVLLEEVLEYLNPQAGGHYLDCTFGAGGYTKAILERAQCLVTAIDQDPNVEKYVTSIKSAFSDRFNFLSGNFSDAEVLTGRQKYDGIVLDLGVSSMQLDEADRGFSFMQDGPLDMRMNNNTGISAANFINEATEEEIANVIYRYGEEVQSRQIAKAIVNYRNTSPITSTLQLAEIVQNSMHYRKSKIHPATKTFQAIRIFINKELENLEYFLTTLNNMLTSNGRIIIVAFHSLEDSIVKNFFKEHSVKKVARSKYATKTEPQEEGKWLKMITKKPVVPSKREISKNYRARSARMRVAEKIGG